jgi:hypothetical protein
MQGTLQIKCIACHDYFRWLKRSWTRDDGYHDWTLDISCRCGRHEDPMIIQKAYEDYRAQLRSDVRRGQNELIDKRMGQGANAALERLCREKGRDI